MKKRTIFLVSMAVVLCAFTFFSLFTSDLQADDEDGGYGDGAGGTKNITNTKTGVLYKGINTEWTWSHTVLLSITSSNLSSYGLSSEIIRNNRP